jgi:hypothetical protein
MNWPHRSRVPSDLQREISAARQPLYPPPALVSISEYCPFDNTSAASAVAAVVNRRLTAPGKSGNAGTDAASSAWLNCNTATGMRS